MVYFGISKVAQKTPNKFVCEKCDYNTSKKSSWEKHIKTKKHLLTENPKKVAKSCSTERFACSCGKSYKFQSGYYRHKTTCLNDPINDTINEKIVDKITKNVINVIENQTIINNNQNILNVNIFLNEKCSNAMSIQEFANQLHLSMEDLDKNKNECLTNVVLKNIKPLSLVNRPFHCTDISNSEWYIKDIYNGWESDTGEKVLNTAEYAINQKWINEFEKNHPTWVNNEKQQDKYVKIAESTLSKLTTKDTIKILKDISSYAKL